MRTAPAPIVAAALAAVASADVTLPAAFTDHMVLQRGVRARVFGSAQVNEQVEVTLYHELGHYLGFDEDGVAELGLE